MAGCGRPVARPRRRRDCRRCRRSAMPTRGGWVRSCADSVEWVILAKAGRTCTREGWSRWACSSPCSSGRRSSSSGWRSCWWRAATSCRRPSASPRHASCRASGQGVRACRRPAGLEGSGRCGIVATRRCASSTAAPRPARRVVGLASKTEGDGKMTFTAAEPGKLVAFDLYFPDFGTTSKGASCASRRRVTGPGSPGP